MTPLAFRAALASIGWSLRGLAERLSCDDRLVRRWASGGAPIPPPIALWLAALAHHHTSLPAPEWRRRWGARA